MLLPLCLFIIIKFLQFFFEIVRATLEKFRAFDVTRLRIHFDMIAGIDATALFDSELDDLSCEIPVVNF